MHARDQDLLRPTLDADLDVRGFGRLFRPQSILWPTFFGGPIAGGILLGLNYRRMGRSDLAARCWIGAAALGLVLAAAVVWFYIHSQASGAQSDDTRTLSRLPRYIVSAISVAAAWPIVRQQSARFTAWESAGNAPANLWGPGLLAVLAGAIAMLAAVFAGIALLGGAR